MSRFWHFIWLICVSNVTVECQSCSILLKTAFCSNICTNVAAEHYDKKIEIVEIIEPNKGDPFIVNLDCLMYFPKAKSVNISPPRRCSGIVPNDRSVGIQGCVNEETETSASKSTTSSSTLTTTTEKVCEKTVSGLPTSPASKDSISSNSETRLKSTSKIITSNIKITTTTSPMTSSMSAPSTSIQHEMKDENLKTETEKLKIEKTTSLTSAPVEVPMKISSEDVHMPNFPTTPAMSHVTAVRQIHSTTNYLETEEIVRVTRTLGVELGRNTNEIPDQKMNPSWFQAMWHIEILAIIGMGWLLCFFFMMCGLATCICKCRTRYSLKSKFEKSEEERKKILKAYNDAENSNREWLHRMFESKRQSGEVQMTSCEVQTDRPLTPPARPRTPVMMRTDRLSGVPVRGILKPSLKPVNSYSLNRFVKEDQGVRAKSFHPKASSIEIPLEKLVPAPKLNQVEKNGFVPDEDALDQHTSL